MPGVGVGAGVDEDHGPGAAGGLGQLGGELVDALQAERGSLGSRLGGPQGVEHLPGHAVVAPLGVSVADDEDGLGAAQPRVTVSTTVPSASRSSTFIGISP